MLLLLWRPFNVQHLESDADCHRCRSLKIRIYKPTRVGHGPEADHNPNRARALNRGGGICRRAFSWAMSVL